MPVGLGAMQRGGYGGGYGGGMGGGGGNPAQMMAIGQTVGHVLGSIAGAIVGQTRGALAGPVAGTKASKKKRASWAAATLDDGEVGEADAPAAAGEIHLRRRRLRRARRGSGAPPAGEPDWKPPGWASDVCHAAGLVACAGLVAMPSHGQSALQVPRRTRPHARAGCLLCF